MLNPKQIKQMLNASYEAEVKKVSVGDFGEQLIITCKENSVTDFEYSFNNCYKLHLDYDKSYPGVGRFSELNQNKLPFYLTNWDVEMIENYYNINLVMWPLVVSLSCKEVCRKEINLK